VTVVLPDRAQRLATQPPRARSLRDALQGAVAAAAKLPLRADLFYDGDIGAALGRPHAVVVTAEQINQVPDPNRFGALRVEFVAYDIDGSFTRFHPGSSRSQHADPHTMQQASRAFPLDRALQVGVGAALHTLAPAAARGPAAATEHGGAPRLCTAMDLQEIHPLDAKLISPRAMEAAMTAALQQAGAGDVDWSTAGYPRWVFMAGRLHQFRAMLEEGIVSLAVTRGAGGTPCLAVRTDTRQYAVRITRARVSIVDFD